MSTTTQPGTPPQALLEYVLLVDADSVITRCGQRRIDNFRIVVTSSYDAAHRTISQTPPAVIVTELVLPDGSGMALCRAAKALPGGVIVLVTTKDATRVPDAIDAGCDGVLLKPFWPNLLFARLGRVLRARTERRRIYDAGRRLPELSGALKVPAVTTNEYWPYMWCPQCRQQGVTSFEFASYRRAWYACLACRAVWVASRSE
jgi:DNA-binding response OmpR family regulator